jgi:hypothetical protein
VSRRHGPLTQHTLLDFAGARRRPDDAAFDAALDAAVAAGRVRSLGGVLFEAADGGPAEGFAAAAGPATTER